MIGQKKIVKVRVTGCQFSNKLQSMCGPQHHGDIWCRPQDWAVSRIRAHHWATLTPVGPRHMRAQHDGRGPGLIRLDIHGMMRLLSMCADYGHIAVVKRLLVGEKPARAPARSALRAPREARQRLVFIDQSDNGLLITRILILRDIACAMGGK